MQFMLVHFVEKQNCVAFAFLFFLDVHQKNVDYDHFKTLGVTPSNSLPCHPFKIGASYIGPIF